MKETQMSSSIASRCSISVTEPESSRIQHLPAEQTSTSQEQRPATSPDVTHGNRRAAQTCCFCWCCSCSRNRFPVKGREEYPKTSPTNLVNFKRQDESPSPEEVRQWGESFDKVMQSCKGRQIFREFLRSEYSEENMLFWLACEDLKKEENAQLIQEKAQIIYEEYISILSPKEVSLDSRVREVLNRSKDHATNQTFDDAQLQIYTLMQRDSYPRFVNSQIYHHLLNKS